LGEALDQVLPDGWPRRIVLPEKYRTQSMPQRWKRKPAMNQEKSAPLIHMDYFENLTGKIDKPTDRAVESIGVCLGPIVNLACSAVKKATSFSATFEALEWLTKLVTHIQ
jgi:hypothetical protein